MIKTIHKMCWVWNFDKEEAWLNEMASKGLALRSVGFCRYDFEDSTPGEYKICIQFMRGKARAEQEKYIEFIGETGAEHVGTVMGWIYMRKKGDAEFALFSDNSSRVEYMTHVIRWVLFITLFNLYIGIYNFFLFFCMDSPMNAVGVLNLIIALLGGYGLIRLYRKRKKMKEEQTIFE